MNLVGSGISVVIVCHQRHEWLRHSIRSVMTEADQVVVVDNGSAGHDVSTIASAEGASAVRLPANLGFPAGVNAGVARATGDVIALLNDDAMADPGWLTGATAVLEDSTIGVVCPKTVFAWPFAEVMLDDQPNPRGADPRPLGRPLRSVTVAGVDLLERVLGPGVAHLEEGELEGVTGRWRWTLVGQPLYIPLPGGNGPQDIRLNDEQVDVARCVQLVNNAGSYLSQHGHGGDFGFAAVNDGRFDLPADRFAASGCAFVTRAEVFRRIGGFPEHYFMYYEDTDWCWRVQLGGLRVRYEPAGLVRHIGGVSTGGPWARHVRLMAARNRLLTLVRNAPMGVAGQQWWWTMKDSAARQLQRMLVKRGPAALFQRRRLARRWERSPTEVWAQWAGIGETW